MPASVLGLTVPLRVAEEDATADAASVTAAGTSEVAKVMSAPLVVPLAFTPTIR